MATEDRSVRPSKDPAERIAEALERIADVLDAAMPQDDLQLTKRSLNVRK